MSGGGDVAEQDKASTASSGLKLHKQLHTHRILERVQVNSKDKALVCGSFAEPSDGLEPSTPSLPWRCSTD